MTVEATSPVLIEQSRAAVTDGQGRYAIVDLRPGTYTVTFSLSGFRTVRREGLLVAVSTAVPVNVSLSVGAVEETVTVTGATPIVDIQQAARREVLNKDLLQALPTNRTTMSAGAIVPGLKMTGTMVGGMGSTVVQQFVRAPGQHARANTVLIDGIDVKMAGYGSGQQAYNNFAMTQEMSLESNPVAADVSGAGVKINMIPRDGGNQFSGDVFFSGMTKAMQADNVTQELRNRGLRSGTGTEWMYDLNPAAGGRIVRDKIWYFASGRLNRAKLAPAGAAVFQFDAAGRPSRGSEPAFNDTATDNLSGRLTYQVDSRHKLSTYYDEWWRYQNRFGLNLNQDPETASRQYNRGIQYIHPTKWTAVWTNRLLTEAAFQHFGFRHTIFQNQEAARFERGSPEWYANAPRQDLVLGYQWKAPVASGQGVWVGNQPSWTTQAAASYITGSHAFKAGGAWSFGFVQYDILENNGALVQQYRNFVPDAVLVGAVPASSRANLNAELGLFAQDQWTIDRFTMNLGLRYEHYNIDIGATSSPAGRFVGERSIQKAPLFRLHEVLPRVSAVYDLFGNAKTAVKVSMGRYGRLMDMDQIRSNFISVAATSEVRNWRDCDFVPGTSTCSQLALSTNGDDIAQDNEIGPSNVTNFGFRAATAPDDDFRREINWQYSVSVDQQVLPNLGVTVGWYHRRESRIWTTYDPAETPSAFTRFDIANPCAASAAVNCGVSVPGDTVPVFNLIPGTPTGNVFITASDENKRVYNGFEVGARARIVGGATVTGGWFTERKVSTLCDVSDLNQLRFCDQAGKLHQELGRVP
ncbi:MAG: carboxypeptidase regulatory-like domain-containing protein, partial [Vicinamibacterales bacterium]